VAVTIFFAQIFDVTVERLIADFAEIRLHGVEALKRESE
jgi:hypothetical protein